MPLFFLVVAPFSAYSSVIKSRKALVAVLGIGLLAACGGESGDGGRGEGSGGAEGTGEITIERTFITKDGEFPPETFHVDAVAGDTFSVKGLSDNMPVTIESANTDEVVISFEELMLLDGEDLVEQQVFTIRDGETISLLTPSMDA
ncbi:hypothetical protein [Flaviflexus massiliensis]|uniref:hypothetical protein n=1 Tax=Flaviflexus massiliensis TaxID=1522309 RepID=UPI0006D59140|nr:hypothetical protein [Flaviflexus massiliensis]